MSLEIDEHLPTRRSLLGRLKNWDDNESWREFFDTYWKLIYNVAMRSGLDEAVAEDIVQETIISVAKTIKEFQYDPALGSFKAWLLQVTRRRIADHFRTKLSRRELDQSWTLSQGPNPARALQDSIWEEEWEKNLVGRAIEKVKSRVKPKQYQLFDCFVLRHWPMEDVTGKLKVTMGQVYFAKYKITALIQKEIKNLKKKWPE